MPSVNEVISNLKDIDAHSFVSAEDRLLVLDELRGALRRVQSPWDVLWDQAWVHGCTMAAIKALIDISVFTRWVETGSKAITTSELAGLTGADPLLLKRLLRHIAAERLITEVGADTYAPTPWSMRVGTESAFASIYGKFYHDLVNPLYGSLPFFLREIGYKNPTSSVNGNFQRVHGEGSNFYEYISSDETLNQQFADAMDCASASQSTPWVDLYNTSQIIRAAKPGCPLVVDVGGSKGHNLETFLKKHPNVPSQDLVLQDLPGVLEKATIHPGITACPYDFFTPQPVKGALIYYLHYILHNWTDEMATKILEALHDAMECGYSKLLVHDVLISDEEPSLSTTTLDLVMMATLSSLERSEQQWRKLIENVEGLRIVKIWETSHAVESIIEVERVSLAE
ncbi:S-adenosyl-L-methionine-dependent methyltransferase [Xylaria sp. FL0933]|nr:S-adenosyl-L-methionine-dependent methyltransferase [Xylaria sp. FL0933]